MEAGPRDTAQGAEHDTADDADQLVTEGYALDLDSGPLSPDGPDDQTPDGVTDDGPEPDEMSAPEVEVELRPQRRLRLWQLAPIVGLGAVGSLMFAFPLFVAGHGEAFWPDLFTAAAWICAIPGLIFSYYAAALYVPMAGQALREGRAARAATSSTSE